MLPAQGWLVLTPVVTSFGRRCSAARTVFPRDPVPCICSFSCSPPPADRCGGLRNGLVTATTASLHCDGAEKSKCIPGVWQGPGGAAAGETAHAHHYRELLQENPKLLLVRAKTSPCNYLPMASSDMTSTAVEKRSMLFCTTMPSMASPV